ncbi:S-adenosyl-l-methionine hydroxide adenosyltransferase family protein [Neobacillus mesonae]|uniref:SAM hydrolase/SAM-dependent halogenase family protein n=1 Tax=Neobacillus mesonae TaxID=1193713 RepID=UPI0020403AD1|nr:S-adenosyl-l-methionine hydroxide adenosyltransferase family protein [Neobacillus mesonae]MCM3568563.1 S-adenosyl-l-methionine hydroxide adenosyltransferase family protein [Neobacillus mesonae]
MNNNLVLQTDFGLSDGAVSAMYGVAIAVQPDIRIFNLTHDIPKFNIWEGSYRLYQTVPYWPEGTVFVSVVDPGVGSERRSIVAKTAQNQYIVTPDNGTLTHIHDSIGITEVRIIDENVNRLPRSGESYTFHGRDVYAYTGARLASNIITFEEAGPEVPVDSIVQLPKPEPIMNNGVLHGNIDILDIRFGNLWTNIDRSLFKDLSAEYGDSFEVTIEHETRHVYKNIMTFCRTFADIQLGEPLLYVNSLNKIGAAINQGSFAEDYHVKAGASWKVSIRKMLKTQGS